MGDYIPSLKAIDEPEKEAAPVIRVPEPKTAAPSDNYIPSMQSGNTPEYAPVEDKERESIAEMANLGSQLTEMTREEIISDPEKFINTWNDEEPKKKKESFSYFTGRRVETVDGDGMKEKLAATISYRNDHINIFSQMGEKGFDPDLMAQAEALEANYEDMRKNAPFLFKQVLSAADVFTLMGKLGVKTIDDGAIVGAAAGTMAALSGVAAPVTVPAAYGIGQMVGSGAAFTQEYRTYERGANAYEYSKLTDKNGKKLDDKLIWAVADAVAGTNAVIEIAGITEYGLSSAGKIIKNIIGDKKIFKTIVAKALTDSTASLISEAAEEGLQGISSKVGEYLMKEYNNRTFDTEFEHDSFKEQAADVASQFTEALTSFMGVAYIKAPMIAISEVKVQKATKVQEQAQKSNKVLSAATEEEMDAFKEGELETYKEKRVSEIKSSFQTAFGFDNEKTDAAMEHIENAAKSQGIDSYEFFDRYIEDVRKDDTGIIGDNYLQYIGETAILSKKERMGKYTAADMIKSGKDPDAVRLATGWFKGKYDQKWRKETKSDPVLNEYYKEGTTDFGGIENFVQADEIFEKYPEMKDIQISFQDLSQKGASGYVQLNKDKGDPLIVISNDMTKEEMNRTLVHEIQHIIQDIEGFAVGSSADRFMKETAAESKELTKEIRSLNSEMSEIINKKDVTSDKAEKEILSKQYQEVLSRRNVITQKSIKLEDNWKEKAFDKYQRVAGEIESRDISARSGMTEEERQNTPPYSSENITPEDAVIFYQEDMTKENDEISVYHGGTVYTPKDIEGVFYVSYDKNQAEEYVKSDEGADRTLQEFKIKKSDIVSEDVVLDLIIEQGYKPKDGESVAQELNLYELIDPNFGTSLNEEDLNALFTELRTQNVKAVEFTDMNLNTLKNDITNIAILDSRIIKGNDSDRTYFQPAAPTDSEAFKKWFGGSKVVDESGSPLVVYHGTEKEFSEFSKDAERATIRDDYGEGFYFTPSKEMANDYGYGKRIIAAYVSMNNPKILEYGYNGEVDVEALKKEGYDGVIKSGIAGALKGRTSEIIAFNPTQIKSVNNSGTYDAQNPNIFFQEAAPTDSKAFKEWFGDSKVVDEARKPLVVYHGTNKEFDIFGEGREKRGFSNAHRLWYFSADKKMSDVFAGKAGKTMPVYLSMQNPKILPMTEGNINAVEDIGYWATEKDLDGFLEQGYDGLMLEDQSQIVAFSPTQIKSVNNSGTYDKNNPNIFYQTPALKKKQDDAYFKAIALENWEEAQKIIDTVARDKGYMTESEYKGSHEAPYKDDDGFHVSIVDLVAKTDSIVPKDFFTHPQYYLNSNADRDSLYKIKAAMGWVKDHTGEDGNMDKIPKIKMYRAVGANVKETKVRNGDWVTPSLEYAKNHGRSCLDKYKIISQAVPVDEVWWDANDINEWGVDDGKNYAYKNTTNNKKSTDVITRDRAGEIIPPSKRFNSRASESFFQKEDDIKYKASVEFLDNGKAIIRATQAADFSSFIHEIGHVMRRQLIGEDLTALETHYGVIGGKWDRGAEESFAEDFEKYHLEGKAPSSRLQTLFAKISEWLAEIYGSIKGEELSEDVRRVLDNLYLNTSEKNILTEIREVKVQYGVEIANAKKVMQDFENYMGEDMDQAEEQALTVAKVIERLEKEFEQIKQTEQDYEAADPNELKSLDSFWQDWQEEVAEEDWNIKLRSSDEYFSELIPKDWQELKTFIHQWTPHTMTKGGRRNPKVDKLLPMWKAAILNKGSFSDKHKNWLMSHLKNHPEYFLEMHFSLSQGGNEDAYRYTEWKELQSQEKEVAEVAKETEVQGEYVANREADAALAYQLAETATMKQKVTMASRIDDPLIKLRILTGDYTVDEIFSDTDENAAIQYNEAAQQIPAAVKQGMEEATKAEKERKGTLERKQRNKKVLKDYVKKLARRIAKKPTATINFTEAEAIRALQEGIDPNFRSRATIRKREGIKDYVLRHPEEENRIPKKVLAAANKATLNDVNIEELEALDKLIEDLRKKGRLKRTLKLNQQKRKQLGLAQEFASIVLDGDKVNHDHIKGTADEMTRSKGSPVNIINALNLRPQRLFDMLDGGQNFKGKIFEYFYNNSNKIVNTEMEEIDRRRNKIEDIAKDLGIVIADLSKPMTIAGEKISKDEILDIYVGQKNELKAEAIKYGNKISDELVKTFTAMLSPEEKSFADAILEDYEENYNRLRDAHIDYMNEDLGKEDNYSPMLRADEGYEGVIEGLAAELSERAGLKKAYADRGFTKSRINISKTHQKKIKLGLASAWMGQIQSQEHYIAGGSSIKEMQAVLNDRVLVEAIAEKTGMITVKTVQDWVNRVANPNIYKNNDNISRISRQLRQNTAVAALAYNVVTMGKQLPSTFLFLPETGVKHLAASAAAMPFKGLEMARKMERLDPQMRNRSMNRFSEELKQTNVNAYDKIIKKIGKSGMWFLYAFDKAAITVGWTAVYNKGMEAGMSEAEAVQAAQNAVLRTQPAGHAKDIAAVYTSNEGMNWILMFTNQINQINNMLFYDTKMRAKKGFKDNDGQAIYEAVLTLTGLGVSTTLIWALSNKELPDEPEDYKEAFTEGFLSSLPIIGGAALAAKKGFFGGGDIAIETLAKGIVRGNPRQIIKGAATTVGLPYVAGNRIHKAITRRDLWEIAGGR